jgi:4-diphosphocytidyl-2-C-methyl-D-erythritol kinase
MKGFPMPTTVRSHAKINLGLGIGAPRPDGFHGLVTVYQTLALYDAVTVTAQLSAETVIRLTSSDRRVPTDSRNTAWKMVDLALRSLGLTADVQIHIEKLLPIQGGLGAGSANAVAALIGLETELNPAPSANWPAERLRLAEQVGSDVPLFLIGGTVLGHDRGQRVSPLPDLQHKNENEAGNDPTAIWCVVATPSVGVSTPQAFRDWDALCQRTGLTPEASEAKLNELNRVYAASFSGSDAWIGSSGVLSPQQQDKGEDLAGPQVSALVRTGIANDFEKVVFLQHPLLSEIKRTLAAAGTPEEALLASLSGSGSALFGLYRGQGDAEAARQRLRTIGVQSLLTRTLPRPAYWRQMLLK